MLGLGVFKPSEYRKRVNHTVRIGGCAKYAPNIAENYDVFVVVRFIRGPIVSATIFLVQRKHTHAHME